MEAIFTHHISLALTETTFTALPAQTHNQQEEVTGKLVGWQQDVC